MNQQKGFSLIEVLLSLLLVTTLAIALIQQQSQSKYLLNQLLIRTQATHHLDQIEETLMTKIKKPHFLLHFSISIYNIRVKKYL